MSRRAMALAACAALACKHAPPARGGAEDAAAAAGSSSVVAPMPASASAASAPALVPPQQKAPFLFAEGSPGVFFAHYAMEEFHQPGISPMAYLPADSPPAATDPRVAILHRYAFVEAPESGGFYYRDLGEDSIAVGGNVVALTGRPRRDVVIQYERSTHVPGSYDHSLIEVWSFGPAGLEIVFTHEIARKVCCGDGKPFVFDDYDVSASGITIRANPRYQLGGASGLRDAGLDGISAMLMPWGKGHETWVWDGARFSPK